MFVFLFAHSARPINVYFICCLGLLLFMGVRFRGENNYLGVGGSLAGWGGLYWEFVHFGEFAAFYIL